MTKERITFSTRRFLVGRAGAYPRLVFSEDVVLRLDQFAHSKVKGEHGGFLIGHKRELKSSEGYEILVERFVPIPQKDDATRLVITKEHFKTVQRALAEGENREEVVGWAHTHPGFGVFLSNFDKEQHQRYFPEPWQVAYILDNVGHERAVYHCVNEEWHEIGGYYILKEMAANERVLVPLKTGPWLRIALLALLIVSFVALGNYGYGFVRKLVEPKPVVTTEQNISPAEVKPVVSVERKEPQSQVADPIAPVTPVLAVQSVPPSGDAAYGQYVVEKGDNLWKIAEKLWGDPSLFKALAEANGITNPSVIPVGKVLKVPQKPTN